MLSSCPLLIFLPSQLLTFLLSYPLTFLLLLPSDPPSFPHSQFTGYLSPSLRSAYFWLRVAASVFLSGRNGMVSMPGIVRKQTMTKKAG